MADHDAAAELFAVLAHPGRLHTLLLLAEHEPRAVGELAEATGIEQTAMSHQLRQLKDARLVRAEREGRHVLYRLTDQHVADIVRDALAHVREGLDPAGDP